MSRDSPYNTNRGPPVDLKQEKEDNDNLVDSRTPVGSLFVSRGDVSDSHQRVWTTDRSRTLKPYDCEDRRVGVTVSLQGPK